MAAANTTVPFPAFPPNLLTHPSRRPSTEVRFSRWNNANAEPFFRRQRQQQEIEDDLRRHRRYRSATRIMEDPSSASSAATPTDYRSRGTPSSPSRPSIPGKASKYSKPENPGHRASAGAPHPAFRRSRASRGAARIPLEAAEGRPEVTVGESGISYRLADAPFEFQYSYTETPKAAPLALREPPIVPFGPGTTPRPWTGRAPLPPSKKKLPEFDSFRPPPPGKKGVKPVQAPGPFLAGSGPKYNAASREEILGEPLTAAEVEELIQKTLKTKRQLNIGRDGLTHNMLDNIHSLWKRRRVCKIKCKGVCTVDMDNVRHQLEEKTGGKIIYSRGGVMYLFRGRNYNYKTRPRFPLMLWKPIPPVYPRLVQRVPEGLTLEEATELRKRGRQLPPICKLGKNGVYYKLVKNVKEAFEECELVRINCQGLNKSDTRKIGSKLKDLVPCVLLSFEFEHILVWRGKDWTSSLPPPEDNSKETVRAGSDSADGTLNSSMLLPDVPKEESSAENTTESSDAYPHLDMLTETKALATDDQNIGNDDLSSPQEVSNHGVTSFCSEGQATAQLKAHGETRSVHASTEVLDQGLQLQVVHNYGMSSMEDASKDTSTYKTEIDNRLPTTSEFQANLNLPVKDNGEPSADSSDPHTECGDAGEPPSASESASVTEHEIASAERGSDHQDDVANRACMEKIMSLLKQATENGSAIVLGEDSSDADVVRQRVIELAKVAPPGPVFRRRPSGKAPVRKIAMKKSDEQEGDPGAEKSLAISENRNAGKKSGQRRRANDVGAGFLNGIVLPHGSLGIDELAKLLR